MSCKQCLVFLVLAATFASAARGSSENHAPRNTVLWYDRPAGRWEEALPIGNGRVGAMVFGGPSEERLQLNEGTLWAGGPYDPVNPRAKAALPEVRRLVFAGKYREAAELIDRQVIATPRGQMPYQTVGDLVLTFPAGEIAEYRRELDLETAAASVRYVKDGVQFSRQVFANAPHNVIVVRLQADRPGSISFDVGMKSPMQDVRVALDGTDTLVLSGRGGDSGGVQGVVHFQTRVKVIASGGEMTSAEDRLQVANADAVTLLIASATNFKRFDDVSGNAAATAAQLLSAAAETSADELWAEHLADYQPLFGRVTLDLGTPEASKLPTDVRIAQFADGGDAPLAALYYQFARYLLISCSRPGGQPANLQGIWNASTNPPWQSKYTININTEMNYWPVESGNLAECIQPLIEMVKELTVTGGRTARTMYGARGWVAHHNTDLWRATAPIDGPNWGMWPTGGAWLCLHLWDRYEYSGDRAVLQQIYPALKGSAEFFIDTLQVDPSGKWLATNPSISPELGHPYGSAVCAGPTMDMQILRDLFANTIKAATILNVDADLREQLQTARARLAPNQIGAGGQLQEWLEDWDLQNRDKRHRHVSHLYGLYPGRDISRRETPQLAAAVKKSLEMRGDRATGWATAWRLCLWAHLGDGDHAYKILKHLISPDLTYPNMFDAHPPFQIDGNFGGAAGIADMLMQSRLGTIAEATDPAAMTAEIEVLPALPSAWPAGSVRGLRARGGFEVDVTWQEGTLTAVTLRRVTGDHDQATVRCADRTAEVALEIGRQISLNSQLEIVAPAP